MASSCSPLSRDTAQGETASLEVRTRAFPWEPVSCARPVLCLPRAVQQTTVLGGAPPALTVVTRAPGSAVPGLSPAVLARISQRVAVRRWLDWSHQRLPRAPVWWVLSAGITEGAGG